MGLGQVLLSVDAEGLGGILQIAGDDRMVGGGGVERVGQVQLALDRIGRNASQVIEDLGRRQQVEADVDRLQSELSLAGVGRFDDAAQTPILDDRPAQRSRRLEVSDRQGAPRAVGRRGDALESGRTDQRHIAREHQKPGRAVEMALDLG